MATLHVINTAGEELTTFPMYEAPGAYRWGELLEIIDIKCQAAEWRLVGVDNLGSDSPVAWVRNFGRRLARVVDRVV